MVLPLVQSVVGIRVRQEGEIVVYYEPCYIMAIYQTSSPLILTTTLQGRCSIIPINVK